ncbi:MAG TPA: flagellar biosynthetic protein FliO [Candidatus Sulfotelmatobacter sp.]|nr:flagellar biosynthetic protein FliO [Candidatus Sulfotelmatobacter sp.]
MKDCLTTRKRLPGAASFFNAAVLVCPFLVEATAHGQTNAAVAPLIAPSLPDAGVSLLRVAGALALVIGIFLGGVWLFKNWQRLALQQGGGPKLKVLETRPLGGRHAIYVLGYEQQRFLISSSPSGVNLLSHLPAAAENDSSAVSKPTFTQALAQALKRQ